MIIKTTIKIIMIEIIIVTIPMIMMILTKIVCRWDNDIDFKVVIMITIIIILIVVRVNNSGKSNLRDDGSYKQCQW